MSTEDLKFMEITNSSAEFNNSHYCMRLLLREENGTMPNNHHVAEQRVLCLKRKLKKNTLTFSVMLLNNAKIGARKSTGRKRRKSLAHPASWHVPF